MNMTATRQRQSGVTLFETMLTLALVVILMSLAVQSVQPPSQKQRVQSALASANEALAAARLVAILQGSPAQIALDPIFEDCDSAVTSTVKLHPNGLAAFSEVCLRIDEQSIPLNSDPLRARLLPNS